MPTSRIVVRGTVQGVGYRDYAKRIADQYEVTGEVWNRDDGAVEIIAQHEDPSILEAYREELRFGPGNAASVQEEPYDPAPDYDGFGISFLN